MPAVGWRFWRGSSLAGTLGVALGPRRPEDGGMVSVTDAWSAIGKMPREQLAAALAVIAEMIA
jgi:hypothetical protein